jgi:hypothetical protein
MWNKASAHPDRRIRAFLLFMTEQGIGTMSILNRYRGAQNLQSNQIMTGVYYAASQVAEISPSYRFNSKLEQLARTFQLMNFSVGQTVINTGTATHLQLPNNCIDYIFTDPPFGKNLAYSELNFLAEAFHGVFTQQKPEAIMSRAQSKDLPEYRALMQKCFQEYCRVLKPGRWMTVVFSNTSAPIWNGIQTAIERSGFVIANVSVLDKKQGSFNAVTNTTSVKQDLVISAYKPSSEFEQRFVQPGVISESAWDFVQTYLGQIPVVELKNGQPGYIIERDPRILFDRMVAWFVGHNKPVPLSSQEFQDGLRQRFVERDGMIFLPQQVADYDKKCAQIVPAQQLELFGGMTGVAAQ